jgi:hypothetical protein
MHAACLSYVKAVASYFLYFTHACAFGDCVCPWRLYDVSAFWWLDSHSGCVSLLHRQGQSSYSLEKKNRWVRVVYGSCMGRRTDSHRHRSSCMYTCTSPLVCLRLLPLATSSETQSKNAESTFSQSQSHVDCSSRD